MSDPIAWPMMDTEVRRELLTQDVVTIRGRQLRQSPHQATADDLSVAVLQLPADQRTLIAQELVTDELLLDILSECSDEELDELCEQAREKRESYNRRQRDDETDH